MKAATEVNRVIGGRYALEEPVGKGGMGEVWRARHLALKSPVAIKFLHGASASNDASRKRFLTEAQVTASLKTRHAVHVFDYGVTDEGVPYLVMELLEGETLDARIGRLGRISVKTTVRLLRQAARALDRAHALGIVHRDFKPENIVILQDEEGGDEVKVVDFGVAKLIGELEPSHHEHSEDALTGKVPMTTFTRNGTMIGTPYYMAPEQIKDSSQVGPPADLWALGVVAYECLTGVRPFEGDTVAEVLRSILERTYAPASVIESSIPVLFDDWFQAVCSPTPGGRFPDALTAIVALGIALEDPIPSATGSDPQAVDLTGGFRILPQVRAPQSALAETLVAGGNADSGIRAHETPAPVSEDPAGSQRERSVSGLSAPSRPPPSRVAVVLSAAAAGCGVAALAFSLFGVPRFAPRAPEVRTGEAVAAATAEAPTAPAPGTASTTAGTEHARVAPSPRTAPPEPRHGPSPRSVPAAAAAAATAPERQTAVPPPTPAAEPPASVPSARPSARPTSQPTPTPSGSPYKLPDLGL